MLAPTEAVRAYAAGYVDGEGHIRWNSSPVVELESCNPFPMRFIARHYGGKVLLLKRRTPTTNRRVYRLNYVGKRAIAFISSILEFLIEKKNQAENLIRMSEANAAIQSERRKKH
jgi:hypothetical protein